MRKQTKNESRTVREVEKIGRRGMRAQRGLDFFEFRDDLRTGFRMREFADVEDLGPCDGVRLVIDGRRHALRY